MHLAAILGALLLCQGVLAETTHGNIDFNAPKWSKYDKYFRKYTKRYFGPGADWRLFKSQAIIESNLNSTIKSNRGAYGVMQILPSTFREIGKKNPLFKEKSLKSPEWNIAAGIFYSGYLYQRWDREVTFEKRIFLMLASYNAGYSRVLKAFNRAGQPENDWQAIEQYIPDQTRDYVSRINNLMQQASIGALSRKHKGIGRLLAYYDLNNDLRSARITIGASGDLF